MIRNPTSESEKQKAAARDMRRAMRLERIWAPRIRRILSRTGNAAADGYAEDGLMGVEIPMQAQEAAMNEALRGLYLQTLAQTRTASQRDAKSAHGHMETKEDGDDSTLEAALLAGAIQEQDEGAALMEATDFLEDPRLRRLWLEYLEPQIATRAKMITDTTRKDIASVVEIASQQGLGHAEASRLIRKKTVGFSKFRADRIAQTEVHIAQMETERATVSEIIEDTQIYTVTKEWIAIQDGFARDLHQEENGTRVDWESKFRVGPDWMNGPGDPTASAQNVINCRCSMAWHDNIPLEGE